MKTNQNIFKNSLATGTLRRSINNVQAKSDQDSLAKISEDLKNIFGYSRSAQIDEEIVRGIGGNQAQDVRTFVSSNSEWNFQGSVDVAGLVPGQSSIEGSNRVKADGSINPFVDNNFTDFKNFSPDEYQKHFGFRDLDGVRDQLKRNTGDDGVPKAMIHSFEKEGAAFSETMSKMGLNHQDTKNLFERASEIDGYLFKEGSGKFGEAANKMAERFQEAGLGDMFKNFGDSIHDQAEVLAHAMKNNMTTEGIKNFSGVYEAYLKNRDNVVNAGLVTREAYEHYKKTGDLKPGVDHGTLQLSEDEFKGLVNKLNTNMARDLANATEFGADRVMKELNENLGVTALNNYDGALFAAMSMTSLMSKEGSDGKTGFDRLVEKSRERDGAGSDKRYDAATNIFTMNDSVSRNTDGTAFSRAEGATLGLDGISTFHGGGLSDNKFSPNTLVLGHQGAADANTAKMMDAQLTAASKAGIDHKIINYMVSGHGSERQQDGGSGGVLLNSEKSGGDAGMFTTKDVEALAPIIAKHLKDGGTFNMTCDACETDELAQYMSRRVSEEAAKIGKNIKTTFRGSEEFGLVSSHQLGERTNGDTRTMVAEDGTQYMHRIRGDHNGGNTRTGEFYSQGKEAFLAQAQETKAENLADSNNNASSNAVAQNDKTQKENEKSKINFEELVS